MRVRVSADYKILDRKMTGLFLGTVHHFLKDAISTVVFILNHALYNSDRGNKNNSVILVGRTLGPFRFLSIDFLKVFHLFNKKQ